MIIENHRDRKEILYFEIGYALYEVYFQILINELGNRCFLPGLKDNISFPYPLWFSVDLNGGKI